jgi:acetyl-CoA C-acetyltransferase
MSLFPRTPVLVGVGQASERLDDPAYAQRSPVELAASAARDALADCGARAQPAGAVARAIDVLAAVRQFEVSTPWAQAPLGRSDNVPLSVARRLGADPARAVLEITGGQSPQRLVNEFAGEIAAGRADVVLLAGAEAISTTRALAPDGVRVEGAPDWSEQVGGSLEDRGYGLEGLFTDDSVRHGLVDAASHYALFETARRARLGLTRQQHARAMAELFAPLSRVAAANPHSAAPVAWTVEELEAPSARNRPIADPYTRLLVARDQVNQAAAVLLMSAGAAERLGVPRDRWVFLHGHADLRERDLLERADLSSSPAAGLAARHALELAGVAVEQLSWMDLYSCFPIAVSTVCESLGLLPGDARGLTLTGGLPYFGGAGNDYSMHAIAEVVARARTEPAGYGLVCANGGFLSKHSMGVYSARPSAWRDSGSARLQAEVDGWPAPLPSLTPDGPATIEACTVTHRREGRTGIVVARSHSDGGRFLAATGPERDADAHDEEALALLSTGEPVGAQITVRPTAAGNRFGPTG